MPRDPCICLSKLYDFFLSQHKLRANYRIGPEGSAQDAVGPREVGQPLPAHARDLRRAGPPREAR